MGISPANSNLTATGAVFGGQLGYNWQTGNWVWGVEGDFDGTNINKFSNVGETIFGGGGGAPFGTTAPFYANVNWLATIRGRLGYAWGPGINPLRNGWRCLVYFLRFQRGGASQRLRVLVYLDEIGLDNRCRLRVAD